MVAHRKCRICGCLSAIGNHEDCSACQSELRIHGRQIRSAKRDYDTARKRGLPPDDEAAQFLKSQGVNPF